MIVRAVIGANFGDEGKGLITDYLCHTQGADIVVRFNGGAQAGHTVVRPDGRRHVFSHFGSGSFHGIPTYLSRFFIINPIAFFRERKDLGIIGVNPTVYAHPDCLITTFADMMINQKLEEARGDKRHGSVGLGINTTVERSQITALKITMGDLWNGNKLLKQKLTEICTKFTAFCKVKPIEKADDMIEVFMKGCEQLANTINPLGIAQCTNPIFEGAQGLLLDQNNKEFYPHLTRSNTGMKNVRILAAEGGLTEFETYYVSRTYLTKHGAGPLPGEDPGLTYEDNTNTLHKFQGPLRFAPLNYTELLARCTKDFGSKDFKLALTHEDQCVTMEKADLHGTGPTWKDVI